MKYSPGEIRIKLLKKATPRNIKKAALITLALPAAYLADVWLLGAASAILYDTAVNIKSIFSNTASSTSSMAPWYFKHPFNTAWAWLTSSSAELSIPAVRIIWLILNGIIIASVSTLLIRRKYNQLQSHKNDAVHVHGLKVVRNPAFGTTRWAGLKDISHFCALGPPQKDSGGVVLGKLEKEIIRVIPGKNTKKRELGLTGHVVAYGVTGSGKSYTFVRNNMIAAVADGQSIVAMDPKGELLETTAVWLEEKGYNVQVFNLVEPTCSHCWNPILECRNDEETAEMTNCMIVNAAKDSHGYFVNKEIQLYEALAGILKDGFPAGYAHPRAAMSLSAWSKEKLEQVFENAYRRKKISPTIYERWRGTAKANFEEAASGLTAKLKIITTPSLAALMSRHEIDLESVGKKKTALFCILPVKGSEVLKPILSVFYMFLFNRLYDLASKNGGRLPVEVRFILDEFANIGQIPGFSEKISTARSLGILLQYILQGRSQLDDVYGPNLARNILASTPISLLLGVAPDDEVTIKMFSSKLGEAAVLVNQLNYRSDISLPVKNFEQAKESVTVGRRKLMEPYEIKEMSTKYCIADIQASKPLFLEKLGWVELPQAKEIKRCGCKQVAQFIPPRETVVELPQIETCDRSDSDSAGIGENTPLLWGIKTGRIKETDSATSFPKPTPGEINDAKENSIVDKKEETISVKQTSAQPQTSEKDNYCDHTNENENAFEIEKIAGNKNEKTVEEENYEDKGIKVSSPLF